VIPRRDKQLSLQHHQRNQHDSERARKSRDNGTEARRSSCEDVNSAVEREEEKVLVKYATRATLPGMSRVIETGEESFICDKRKLRLLYIYFH